MPAVIKVGAFTGASSPGTYNNITSSDSLKVSFDLSDTYNGTTTLTIPTGTTRTFSWYRNIKLYCVTGASTTLSNVKVAVAASPAINGASSSHLYMYYKDVATYTQASGANKLADDTVTTTPAGQTAFTVDPTFSAAITGLGGAATTATPVGTDYFQVSAGVDGSYTGGGNANTTLPNIEFQYDEA